MKTIIALISLFTMLTVQASMVSPKMLIEIEIRIEMQRDALNEKLNAADTNDITEGKIVATMALMIEEKLAEAVSSLDAIETDADLTEENVNRIHDLLDESEKLISEI